jgi:DNA-directed RNA polymerase specialized sigma subunit
MDYFILWSLVKKSQLGDKKALNQILLNFQPLISKVCRNVPLPQRHDLSQHIAEKVIRAVKNYNMDATPTYSSFISSLSPDPSKKLPPTN